MSLLSIEFIPYLLFFGLGTAIFGYLLGRDSGIDWALKKNNEAFKTVTGMVHRSDQWFFSTHTLLKKTNAPLNGIEGLFDS